MDKPLGCAERVWTEFLAVLDALPPTTRAVFLLHALFDASSEEIEHTIGVRSDACPNHLARARRAVQTINGGNT